jgi:hypothetical protein
MLDMPHRSHLYGYISEVTVQARLNASLWNNDPSIKLEIIRLLLSPTIAMMSIVGIDMGVCYANILETKYHAGYLIGGRGTASR